MALAYADAKKYPEGAEKMSQALGINPEMYKGNPDIAYNMGETFFKARKLREAKQCLKHLHDISPGYKDCEDMLAKAGGNERAKGVSA